MGLPSSPTRSQAAKPILKVVYLFAGKRRHSDVAAFLKKAETEGGVQVELHEFDIERSPQHDLTDNALWDKIFDTLKEGNWVLIVSPPCNTFSRARFQNRRHPGPKPLRTRMWPRGFPWLSAAHRSKVDEANTFVDRCIHACQLVSEAGGYFLLEHPEDLGTVEGEQPGSIWQWPEVLELIPCCNAVSFAIHQCHFGAPTPKPTRFMTNMEVADKRCYVALPKFDRFGFYKGPLPKKCGHHHTKTLIGKTNSQWNTAPSAAYPPGLCQFIADLILYACASFGRGGRVKSTGVKRDGRKLLNNHLTKRQRFLLQDQFRSCWDSSQGEDTNLIPKNKNFGLTKISLVRFANSDVVLTTRSVSCFCVLNFSKQTEKQI